MSPWHENAAFLPWPDLSWLIHLEERLAAREVGRKARRGHGDEEEA